MINTINHSLEEGEAGLLLRFNVDLAQLKKRDQYIVQFDSPVSLPYDPPISLSYTPDPPSYSIINSGGIIPQIFVKIKSLHRAETKTLLRLTIKDIYNTILYVDYLLIICSPQSTLKFEASLLPSNISGNVGDNGGSKIKLAQPNTIRLDVGMSVTGPGLSSTISYAIKRIETADTIELDKLVPTFDNRTISGTFTFTRTTGCVDPSSLALRSSQPVYTILDFSNNWTYEIGNRIIAQFIVENKEDNLDTIVLLPIKNASLLNNPDNSAAIPSVSIIKAGGRVMNDSQCLSGLVFS
jgi:hypothetical protein